MTLIPLGIGIPLGFVTPTEKSNFGWFWLGVINLMGIREFPWELTNFPLLTLTPMGVGILLGFITPTEKSNFGRFWLSVINPKGINQFFTFDFDSLGNWISPIVPYLLQLARGSDLAQENAKQLKPTRKNCELSFVRHFACPPQDCNAKDFAIFSFEKFFVKARSTLFFERSFAVEIIPIISHCKVYADTQMVNSSLYQHHVNRPFLGCPLSDIGWTMV